MTRHPARLAGLVLVLAASLAGAATPTASASAPAAATNRAFARLVDEILADLYARNPTFATDLGLHRFDARLEDYSAAAVAAEVEAIDRFETVADAERFKDSDAKRRELDAVARVLNPDA